MTGAMRGSAPTAIARTGPCGRLRTRPPALRLPVEDGRIVAPVTAEELRHLFGVEGVGNAVPAPGRGQHVALHRAPAEVLWARAPKPAPGKPRVAGSAGCPGWWGTSPHAHRAGSGGAAARGLPGGAEPSNRPTPRPIDCRPTRQPPHQHQETARRQVSRRQTRQRCRHRTIAEAQDDVGPGGIDFSPARDGVVAGAWRSGSRPSRSAA